MSKIKPVLNRWQFVRWLHRDHFGLRSWDLTLGLIRLTSFPEVGYKICRENHDGLVVTIHTWPPLITFRRKYFQVFGLQQMITYPVQISFKHMFVTEVW